MQNNDELANLWQTQPTQKVDVEAVKKSFHQETTKQRRYFILDCLAMLPGAILLFTYWAEFSLLAKVMIGGIFLLSYPIVGYQLWLRRIAAFAKSDGTNDYLGQLSKQFKNNIRIAVLNKHSAWSAALFLWIFWAVMFFTGELKDEKILKTVVILVSTTIVMIGWYIWADKRKQRFQREWQSLQDMKG